MGAVPVSLAKLLLEANRATLPTSPRIVAAVVRGHVKVPAGGHEKSPRVASESPHLASVVSVGS